MTREGYTKIVNFMTPRAGALLLGRVRFSHIKTVSLKVFSSSPLLKIDIKKTTHIVCCSRKGIPK